MLKWKSVKLGTEVGESMETRGYLQTGGVIRNPIYVCYIYHTEMG